MFVRCKFVSIFAAAIMAR